MNNNIDSKIICDLVKGDFVDILNIVADERSNSLYISSDKDMKEEQNANKKVNEKYVDFKEELDKLSDKNKELKRKILKKHNEFIIDRNNQEGLHNKMNYKSGFRDGVCFMINIMNIRN